MKVGAALFLKPGRHVRRTEVYVLASNGDDCVVETELRDDWGKANWTPSNDIANIMVSDCRESA
jgi:hypothetical protein